MNHDLGHAHGKSQRQHDLQRQMNNHKLALRGNYMSVQRAAGGRLVREFSWHWAAQAAASEASAEGFAYCFFGCPEVEEGLGGVGELAGGEPAAGEGLDGEVSAEFYVDADWTRVGGGYCCGAGGVGEGDVEALDDRPAVGLVGQRGWVAEGVGELAEQVVGGFAGGVGAGAHPDVHGFRFGARGFIHREKVTR
jgi:hypothetical protein